MNIQDIKQRIIEDLKISNNQCNKDLFPYLSMRLHVIAEYVFEAKTDRDIILALQAASKYNISLHFISGGTNVVARTSYLPGLTVLNAYSMFTVVSEEKAQVRVRISSGYPMSLVVDKTVNMGLSGFEYHKGLPGQLGGALYMNSKWTKPISYVGDSLVTARIINRKGDIKQVDRAYFSFGYDHSTLQQTGELVLDADFVLHREDKQLLLKRADSAFEYRKKTQPMGVPTCGCFFRNISEREQNEKNIPTKSAGYLIDQCGLKGKSKGGFSISSMHANFIVNTDKESAKPEDLFSLIADIKKTVKERFGITLQEEVVLL